MYRVAAGPAPARAGFQKSEEKPSEGCALETRGGESPPPRPGRRRLSLPCAPGSGCEGQGVFAWGA